MSPVAKTSYTRAEVREVREAFRDCKWGPKSVEPDGRVTVLYDRQLRDASPGFLCRWQHGWFWVMDAPELVQKALTQTPFTWKAMIEELADTEHLTVPTEQELEMGGFQVTVDEQPEPESEDGVEELPDEAKKHLDAGFHALDIIDIHGGQVARAQAHFLGSIAVSLYELVALHKKYDFENVEVQLEDRSGATIAELQKKLDEMPEEGTACKDANEEHSEDFPWAR